MKKLIEIIYWNKDIMANYKIKEYEGTFCRNNGIKQRRNILMK